MEVFSESVVELAGNGGYDPGQGHDADIFVLVPPNPTPGRPDTIKMLESVPIQCSAPEVHLAK